MNLDKFIILLLFITGCTAKGTNSKVSPCAESDTLVCEIRGKHKDCWCQDTIQLRRHIGETGY